MKQITPYAMYNKFISNIKPLGFTWETNDPFLFCVHHLDQYPKGNSRLGPAASLEGRRLGQDFVQKDGWRMYHGEEVPGFPAHPHRGFETVTIVLNGFVDHSDSHGAAGRYGYGDVQWMTAGRGLQHCEMFPLTNQDTDNPLELFQIWLNLPREKKFADPHYVMLWNEEIPKVVVNDENGRQTEITLIAGELNGHNAPAPAPDSWAANPDNKVCIGIIKMEPHAKYLIPAAEPEVNRTIYFYKGSGINIAGFNIKNYHSADLPAEESVLVENSNEQAFLLLLQGKPINEPVVQHGTFVMNSPEEIQMAFSDYRKTNFGGWPWNRNDIVHPIDKTRFARYADGSEIYPDKDLKID